MTDKEIERAAYVAAHRILEANTAAPELACAGARRSYAVDTIADIIREAFERYDRVAELGRSEELVAEIVRRPIVPRRVDPSGNGRASVALNLSIYDNRLR